MPQRALRVVSEFERLTKDWIRQRGCGDEFLRSYGATEVFPPEDADLIVAIAASGATLTANNLTIVDTLLSSSTRLYASRQAMEVAEKRAQIDAIKMLVESVLSARSRIMLEVNVSADRLTELVALLPCMRQPTVASLHNQIGYAVKVAVPRADLPTLIPRIKQAGGTDIVVSEVAQIVP